MEWTNIYNMIMLLIPTLISIISMIGVVVEVLKKFAALKKEVANMKDMEHVKNKLNQLLEENDNLQKYIKELLTKIDHVDRSKDEDKKKN